MCLGSKGGNKDEGENGKKEVNGSENGNSSVLGRR